MDVTAVVVGMTDAERPFLEEAILSAVRQSHSVEVVVYVAEDNTWVGTYQGVRIRKVPLRNISQIRNLAAQECRTEWVAFLDGDDSWHARKIERQLAVSKEQDLVGCNHIMTTEEGRPFAFGLSKRIPMPSSWLVRTAFMRQVPFAGALDKAEDSIWWRDAHAAGVRARRLPNALLRYRVRAGSLSSISRTKQRKERIRRLAERAGLLRMGILAVTFIAASCNRSPVYEPTRMVRKVLSAREANSAVAGNRGAATNAD